MAGRLSALVAIAASGRNPSISWSRVLSQPGAYVGLLVGLVFVLKLAAVLSLPGYLGVDGGAYLLSLYRTLGIESTGADFLRPPLAPGLLLAPFVYSLGPELGLKLFHILASLAIVYPFWLFARLYLSPWATVIAAAFMLADWQLLEMFIVGPLPMLGFSGILTALWAMHHLFHQTHSRRHMAVLALAIPGIAYTNQTGVGISLVVFPLYILGLRLFSKGTIRPLVLPSIIGIVLAATALPWYAQVRPGSDLLRYPGPLFSLAADAYVWYFLGVGVVIVLWTALRGSNQLMVLALLLTGLLFLTRWVSVDETLMNVLYRSRYFLIIPLTVLAIALVSRWVQTNPLRLYPLLGYAGIVMVLLLYGDLVLWQSISKTTQMVTADTNAAILHLDEKNDTGGIVVNSYSMALYVAALTQRPVAWVQVHDPPLAYRQQHSYAVCILGWVPACDPAEATEALDTTHALAETRWPTPGGYGKMWGAPDDPWELTSQAPWLQKEWQRGTTTLWRIQSQ